MAFRGVLAALCLAGLAVLGGCAPGANLSAAFKYAPTAGPSPLTVTFDATNAPRASTPQIYSWEFGDGATAMGPHVAHTYVVDQQWVFTVRLSVTDGSGRLATASADVSVLPPVPPPSGPAVGFTWPFHYDAAGDDAENLNDEYLTLLNEEDHPVDLSGWTIENERGVTFRFPHGAMLASRATITVHSGGGADSETVFYWRAGDPVWSDRSDLAILRDAQGNIVDVYAYISC
ncbi:MAG: lamin tail domain-containing protein [Candidatus Bipolaricaulota bacterium]